MRRSLRTPLGFASLRAIGLVVVIALAGAPGARGEQAPVDPSERALELEAREAALRALEGELDRKLDEMRSLREQTAMAIEPAEERRKADVQKLVAFYQAMKPASAAKLLEELPRPLAADVLGSMKARDAGKILNKMNTERAAQLSKWMAGQE
jgi:flagellar motility protein MotE (MotC chaperone)